MFSRILMLGANHRLICFLFLVLATYISALNLSAVKVDTGFKRLVSDENLDKPIYDRIIREFGSDNRSIVYVKDPDLWSPSKLVELEKLHHALEGLPVVERVDDLFTLRSIRGAGNRIDSRLILPEAPPDRSAADRARADALYNPLIVGNFLSSDATATVLLVSVRTAVDDEHFPRGVYDALEAVIEPARSVFEEVFQVGPPRMDAELKAVLFDDLKRLGPLSAILLAAMIFVFLRSGFAALAPLATSTLSIVWTFGMMGWAGVPLNILTAMLPSLIIVIGSTENIHMLSTYFLGVSKAESDRRRTATRFMMQRLGVPLLLTILTTAMGFASNIFSNMGLIRDFAIASTFAILSNGLITILFVPLALSVLGPRKTRLFQEKDRVSGLPGLFVRIFGFTHRRFPKTMLALTAVLCVFFVHQASRLVVTNDPMSYFREDQPLIRDTRRIHHDLAGIKFFFITLESERAKAFQEPKNVEKLVGIQHFLEKQGIFDRSLSLADHLSLVNREFNGGSAKYFKVPGARELIAQHLLFFHRHDLENYVNHDYSRANIVVRHNVGDSTVLNRHIRELREAAADIAGDELKIHVVGENLMINAAAESLLVGQIDSIIMLLCVIFLIMSAMFTSFKVGIISLIPNLIPIVLMFGIMGLLDIPLNPGTAMVAVIAIGIAIDGAIHLFSRYNELCRRTSDYEAAVHATVREMATPMVATSFALALGFGILLNSNFTVIAQFGALSAVTMMFALFANLLITPIIMTRIRMIGLHQILSLSMHKEVLEKSPLFYGMSNYQMRKAILISELQEFKKGELLVEQGTVGRNMYLILSGQVDVVRRNKNRSERVAVLNAGQILGEVGYAREIKRTADVRALTPVEALRFDYKKIEKDLKFFPYIVAKLNFNISCILGERLANMLNRMSPHGEIPGRDPAYTQED